MNTTKKLLYKFYTNLPTLQLMNYRPPKFAQSFSFIRKRNCVKHINKNFASNQNQVTVYYVWGHGRLNGKSLLEYFPATSLSN